MKTVLFFFLKVRHKNAGNVNVGTVFTYLKDYLAIVWFLGIILTLLVYTSFLFYSWHNYLHRVSSYKYGHRSNSISTVHFDSRGLYLVAG